MSKKKVTFGYIVGRVLTAVLALTIGIGLFFWISLNSTEYADLPPISEANSSDIKKYEKYSSLQKTNDKIHLLVNPEYPIRKVKQKDPSITNILVFGIDSRGEDTARSDAMIILTIDNKHREIKMTSVLRDTEMSMNDMDGQRHKVNAAYAFGGVGMLINTLNANLDLDIQEFVMFDFTSSMGMVDALGGVPIELATDEIPYANRIIEEMAGMFKKDAKDYVLSKPGKQKLNGMQAIAWARIRYLDSDFGRTSRQRRLMDSMISEFGRKNPVAQGKFLLAILEDLSTNLNNRKMISTGLKGIVSIGERHQYSVPADGMYTTNTNNWNMIFDPNLQIPALHEFIWQNVEEE